MYISKKDALMWFEFFAGLPDWQELNPKQMELILATLAQLERAAEKRREKLSAKIPHLKSMNGRTMYVGSEEKFPKGCVSCLFGTGLGAIRKTNRCNAACPFCYDYGVLDRQMPIGDGMWEIGGSRYYEKDLPLLFSVSKKPTGVAYVYLEPFCEIEAYYGIIRAFREQGIWQHMYTNGIACTEENLKKLGEAGLNELRFNLGATNCSDLVIGNMKTAKKYIPSVGIETPLTEELFDSFMKKKDRILETGADFMNCAELHLTPNNLCNYIDQPLYMARQGYLSPIRSRELTLELMAAADSESWDMLVHDCSNDTKFARDLNLKVKEGSWFGANAYGREFDRIPCEAFLAALRSEDIVFEREEDLPAGYRPGELY